MTAGASSPPGYCLTASSDFTDSALPGRKETVSFSWASSNWPANRPPTTAEMRMKTPATTNFDLRPAGRVRSRAMLQPYEAPSRLDLAGSSVEQRGELVGLGHGPPAREALADVRGGAPVDGLTAREQRHPVGLAAGQHDPRAVGRAHHALERCEVLAHERDLAHGGDGEVDRLEQVPERGGVLGGDRVQQADHAERGVLVAVLAGQGGEPQQSQAGGRLARRDRVVLDVLAACDQPRVVRGRREEAAVVAIREALED